MCSSAKSCLWDRKDPDHPVQQIQLHFIYNKSVIKAVIFDYGKVISDSPGTHVRKDIAKAFKSSEDEVGKVIGKLIGRFRKGELSENEFWEVMAKELDREIPEHKYELWKNDFRKKLVIFDDMLMFVRELKAKGLKVGVMSNNIMPFVDVIKERQGFSEFELVLNSCEVGLSKPDEDIYQLALTELDLSPNEVLFIDDRKENIDTAKRLGMHVLIAQKDRDKVREDIKQVLNLV